MSSYKDQFREGIERRKQQEDEQKRQQEEIRKREDQRKVEEERRLEEQQRLLQIQQHERQKIRQKKNQSLLKTIEQFDQEIRIMLHDYGEVHLENKEFSVSPEAEIEYDEQDRIKEVSWTQLRGVAT